MEKESISAKREQITLRLPVKMKEELMKEATKRGLSFNAYLLWLIDKGRQD